MVSTHRSGTVALVGRPNVGKSTLLNSLLGVKLSIVSPRPQTTRGRITGILTRADAQLVFVDTPGFQQEHRGGLNRLMNRSVRSALGDVDLVIAVYEALRYDKRDRALTALLPTDRPVIAAISKIDRVKDKGRLLPFIDELATVFPFREIVPVSAARGIQIEALVRAAIGLLPEEPAQHGNEEITLASERFLAAEFVREKLFRTLGEELPYQIAVEIEEFRTEGTLRRIRAVIVTEKKSQKAIVIGREGEILKRAGIAARRDLERLFGGKVHLELWVRARSGWADDARALARFGYE